MSVLKGVGTSAERDLALLEIETVLDLVTHYPRRYIDGTRLVPISDLAVGDKASVLGQVTRVSRPPSGYGRGRRRSPSRVVVQIADASGRLDVVFFNQVWRAKQLPVGTQALFYGTVGSYRGALQLTGPTAEVLRSAGDDAEPEEGERSGRIFPVYPLTDKANLSSARISRYGGRGAGPGRSIGRPAFSNSGAIASTSVDRTAAFDHIHRPARPWPTASRPAGDWPSTSCSGCSSPWCCARSGCGGTPAASATGSCARTALRP